MRDEDICWYHGKITREEADEILKEGNIDTTILVPFANVIKMYSLVIYD